MPLEEASSEGSPNEWLRYARSDLELARMAPPKGVVTAALCFHAQQAAEKAVKAVLLAEGVSFPFTHDIKRLLEHLPAGYSVPKLVHQAVKLTKYAVMSRYPSDVPVTGAEREEAVRLAEATVRWAEKHVP